MGPVHTVMTPPALSTLYGIDERELSPGRWTGPTPQGTLP
jgi:hypothetical protein